MGIFSSAWGLVTPYCGVCVCDVVAHARARIEPERRRSLKAAAKRDQKVLRDVALGESDLAGLGAVHVEMQFRIVEWLLDAEIDRSRNEFQLVHQIFGEVAIALQIASHYLHVEGSGQAEIQDLRHDVDGQFVKLDARKIGGQARAELVYVFFGRMVLRRQLDLDVRIGGPDRSRGAIGKIQGAVWQADVVDDGGELRRGNDLANVFLHAIGDVGGFLDSCAGCRPHVQFEFAAVNGREKVPSDQRKQHKRKKAKDQKRDYEQPAVADR